MSSTAAVVEEPQPLALVCELHVWSDAFLSWSVSSVMVRMVVPVARIAVLSLGLSVVIFMYCADAGPAKNIETKRPRARFRTANLMSSLLSEMDERQYENLLRNIRNWVMRERPPAAVDAQPSGLRGGIQLLPRRLRAMSNLSCKDADESSTELAAFQAFETR